MSVSVQLCLWAHTVMSASIHVLPIHVFMVAPASLLTMTSSVIAEDYTQAKGMASLLTVKANFHLLLSFPGHVSFFCDCSFWLVHLLS